MRLGLDFLFQYEGITSDMLIWGAFLAVSLAACIAWIDRRFRGALIRALIAAEAYDPATARTLAEAGCARNPFVRLALFRRQSSLSLLLERLPAKAERTAPALFSFAAESGVCRYYIPQRSREKACALYAKKGSGFGTVLLTVFLFFFLALLAINLTGTLNAMIAWAFG